MVPITTGQNYLYSNPWAQTTSNILVVLGDGNKRQVKDSGEAWGWK